MRCSITKTTCVLWRACTLPSATLQYVCYNQTKTSRWASCIKARGWYFVESYRTPASYPSQDVSNASGIGAALEGKPEVVYEPPNGAIVTK